MNYISFTNFDDLQVAAERKIAVQLSHFRNVIKGEESDESARVLCHVRDGNDYAIIEAVGGDEFFLIALTNRDDGMADFICFDKHISYASALLAMTHTMHTDYTG